ncbi:AAA family ATPase [Vibrio sp. JC009]|uniref:AAA family ATPase n=1 Tax=Vibrio sp. JC009 TaxID=2912314 RepID=UPI0023B00E01|nr:AAA family ATPase [Vibrio sp. JC009]WED22805.1 AAA family ATPase [Vibrio sp. JC009]
MKLLRIKIKNFRQFYGTQEIEFSTDLEKCVTLIHGENNGGKTALLNALRWCLYEETTENLLEANNLLNKHALAEGQISFSVFIELLYNNKLYEVRRTKSRSNTASVLKLYEIRNGCYVEQPNANELIATFLPTEMSQYFFYQGEGTGTLNSQNSFSHINEAISKVLGLTIAEKTTNHLRSIKNGYQRDLKQFDTSNELSKAISDKETLESRLDKDKAELSKLNLELIEVDKIFEEQIAKLATLNTASIEHQLKLRSEKQSILSLLHKQYNDSLSKKSKNISKWVKSAFSKSLSQIDLSSIDIDELNQKQRYSVDKKLIDAIINNAECICGRDVTENSDAANLLKELSKFAVDPKLKQRWAKATDLLTQLRGWENPKFSMGDLLSQLDDCQDQIANITRQINELTLTIKNSDIADIKNIENAKANAKSRRDQLHKNIPALEQKINRAKIDIDECERRISKLSSNAPQAERVNKLIHATDEILKLYNNEIEKSKKDVDAILLKKMQNFFSQVAFNGYTVQKDSKVGSYTWAIVDRNSKKVAAGNGYQAMLSISFIIALIQFSKDRINDNRNLLTPGTVAPFIADSILAFIGPDNGRELVRFIADSVDQSIFMFSQAQWTESHTDKGIRDKIGKEYNLVQHTVLSESEFKGQYPTSLVVQGKQYDVVRFGSEFDKVTIEEVAVNG